VPECEEGTQYNEETNECDSVCEDENRVYNSETQQCELACEEGQAYDSESDKCVDIQYVSNLAASDSWLSDDADSDKT